MTKQKKGFKTWRYRKYANSIIPAVQVETDRHKTKAFYDAMKELILAIHDNITSLINYDHISYVLPKYNLPLKYENAHYCISYLNGNGDLVMLFISVIEKEKVAKKWGLGVWQKEDQ
jgi:hypothetical protein